MKLKTKMKALAAAVTLVMAGSANAAIFDDYALTGSSGLPTGGELFLNVIDLAQSKSYVLDMNVNFADFQANKYNTAYSWSKAADANLQSLLGGVANSADVHWSIFAISNATTDIPTALADLGYLTTSSGFDANFINAGLPNAGFNGMLQVNSTLASHLQRVNMYNSQSIDVDGSILVTNPNDPTYLYNSIGNGDRPNLHETEVTLGQSQNFYFVGLADANLGGDPNLQSRVDQFAGTWTLATNGTLSYSAVPVPAAIWLLGSAIAGLFGVSRRRVAV